MGSRYIFEISNGPSKHYHFVYFDTEDHLADFLFAHEHVDVTIEGEFGVEDDPYLIIICQIPKDQCDRFLRCIEMLPELMKYVGKTDYDAFCLNIMMNAAHYMARKKTFGRSIPLQ